MKKRNVKKSILALMLVTMFISGVNGGTLEVLASGGNFTITGDVTTLRKSNVELEVEVTDDLSGIGEITLPDGTTTTETKSRYTIDKNGTYLFKVKDKAGNETSGNVEVTSIHKTPPTLEVTTEHTGFTNNDVVIDVKATAVNDENGEGNEIAKTTVKVGEDEVEIIGGTFTVSEDGEYVFTTTDLAGNSTTKSITISGINKTVPVITIEDYSTDWTNQNVTIKASVTGSDDISLNEEEHTFEGNGSFTFKASDKYGNTVSETVTIGHIDKVEPALTIKVVE